MNVEQLLKSISELIKKNEQFFTDNIEIFKAVEDRLFKASSYDEDNPYYGDDYSEDEDSYDDPYSYEDEAGISQYFDDLESGTDPTMEEDIDEDMDGILEDDEAAQWLRENAGTLEDAQDEDGDGDIDLSQDQKDQMAETDAATDKNKVSRGGYREWQPQDRYESDQLDKISKLMSEGWSHREAERMAGAGRHPSNFYEALNHKIHPSQPSEKMLATVKGLAGDWLRNAQKKLDASADAEKSPLKHASSKHLEAHDKTYRDFDEAFNNFLQSDEISGLSGRARHNAIKDFKKKYNEENPDYREKVISHAGETSNIYQDAQHQRNKKLLSDMGAIEDAGKIGGDISSSAGEFSGTASGGMGGLTAQGAAQMVGGEQDEGGYTAGTTKDPAMLFREKHKTFVGSPEWQKKKDKLMSKLSPDRLERYSAISAYQNKKPGGGQ